MRILYISDIVYPCNKGGSEYRIHKLSQLLEKKGHEVSVVCGKWWEGKSMIGNLIGVPMVRNLYSRGGRSATSSISFTLSLLRALPRLERYDVIEFNMSPMLHFSLLDFVRHTRVGRSAVVVGALHEVWQEYWLDYAGLIYGSVGYLLEHQAAKKLDHIVTISEFNVRKLARWKVPSFKISVIRPGVDWDEIWRSPRSELSSDLIFAGRLVESKRPDLFIKIVYTLKRMGMKEIKAVVVGGGPLLKPLQSMARSLDVNDRIEFMGTVDRSLLLSLLKSSKIFVAPVPPEGGWSIAFLEANAAGLPVLSSMHSSTGTSVEIIKLGINGFIISSPDPLLFAEKVRMILQNEHLIKTMSLNSIQFAKAYDWKVIAHQTCELYERLIADRDKRALGDDTKIHLLE